MKLQLPSVRDALGDDPDNPLTNNDLDADPTAAGANNRVWSPDGRGRANGPESDKGGDGGGEEAEEAARRRRQKEEEERVAAEQREVRFVCVHALAV